MTAVTCKWESYKSTELLAYLEKEREDFYFTYNEFDGYKTCKMDMTTFITCILFSFLLFPTNKHHPFFMSNQPQLIIFLPINKVQLSLQLHSKHFARIFHSESLWNKSHASYINVLSTQTTDVSCFIWNLCTYCAINLLQLCISYIFYLTLGFKSYI